MRATVQLSSLQSYLSPINTRHTVAGYSPPAVSAYISSVRAGYARKWYDRAGALPLERAKFLAAAAWAIADEAARTRFSHTRTRLTTIVTAFLFFRRKVELLRLTLADVTLRADGGVELHVVRFKGAERRAGARRLPYSVPPDPRGYDLPLALLRDRLAWLAAGGVERSLPGFAPLGARKPPKQDDMARRLAAACPDVRITAQVGSFFAPSSTRGGRGDGGLRNWRPRWPHRRPLVPQAPGHRDRPHALRR